MHCEYSIALEDDPIPRHFAPEFTTTFGQLPGVELRFAQALRPIGSQGAMRRTGYGIFGHAIARFEIARDEIDFVSGRGD